MHEPPSPLLKPGQTGREGERLAVVAATLPTTHTLARDSTSPLPPSLPLMLPSVHPSFHAPPPHALLAAQLSCVPCFVAAGSSTNKCTPATGGLLGYACRNNMQCRIRQICGQSPLTITHGRAMMAAALWGRHLQGTITGGSGPTHHSQTTGLRPR